MGLASQVATISLILLFALDVFTDVATGVELILNDKPFCELFFDVKGVSKKLRDHRFFWSRKIFQIALLRAFW